MQLGCPSLPMSRGFVSNEAEFAPVVFWLSFGGVLSTPASCEGASGKGLPLTFDDLSCFSSLSGKLFCLSTLTEIVLLSERFNARSNP